LNGGTVWLSPQFQGGTITNLMLSGPSLAGTNIVTGLLGMAGGYLRSGPTTVGAGGQLSVTNVNVNGDSPLTIGAGGVLNVAGFHLGLLAPLTNNGTANLISDGVSGAYVDIYTGGEVWNQAGAVWNLGDGSYVRDGGGRFFHNAAGATLRKTSTGNAGV